MFQRFPNASSKKVLIFSTLAGFPFWEGSEKFWYDFVRTKSVRAAVNFQIVLAESPATRKHGSALQAIGTPVDYYVPYGMDFFKRNFIKTAQKLKLKQENYAFWYKHIEKYSPSLVWFNVASTEHISNLSFAVNLCLKNNIPYWIVLQHAPPHFFIGDQREFTVFAQIIEGAAKIVFVSEQNKLTIEKSVGKRLENSFKSVNGVNENFIGESAKIAAENSVAITGKARFLCLARLSLAEKGQHILLEALASAAWEKRDWELNLVGSGDPFLLRRLIDYFNIEPNRVKFTEKVSDILPIIAQTDLILSPSLSEAGPFVTIEAMACGRPAIGTPVGDMPHQIEEGKTGWLTESTEVRHFAEALERAWMARAFWKEIGENARKRVISEYNQSKYMPELLEVLLSDMKN